MQYGYEHLHIDSDFSLLDGYMSEQDPQKANFNDMLEGYEYRTADQCETLKEQVQKKGLHTYTWGTYGAKKDEELQRYSIDNLSNQHLENILITQPQISNELAAAILMLLKKRWKIT